MKEIKQNTSDILNITNLNDSFDYDGPTQIVTQYTPDNSKKTYSNDSFDYDGPTQIIPTTNQLSIELDNSIIELSFNNQSIITNNKIEYPTDLIPIQALLQTPYKCRYNKCNKRFKSKQSRGLHESQMHANYFYENIRNINNSVNKNIEINETSEEMNSINKMNNKHIKTKKTIFEKLDTSEEEFFNGYYIPSLYQQNINPLQQEYKFRNTIQQPKQKYIRKKLMAKLTKNLIPIFNWVKLLPSASSLNENEITE